MNRQETTTCRAEIQQQVVALIEVSRIDLQVARFENSRKGIPLQISRAEDDVHEAEQEERSADEAISDLKKEIKEKETEVLDARGLIGQKRAKLTDVKTNKEYTALLRETDLLEKKIESNEERQLEIMELLEGKGEELRLKKEEADSQRKKYKEFKALKEEEKVRLGETIQEERAKREDAFARLDPELARKYGRIVGSGKTDAVIAYKDQACQACYNRVTPQEEIEMRRGSIIINCPQCGRFLYWGE